jgi:arsenate reductase
MSLCQSHPGYVLIHNPRCSKSRAVLEILEQRGVAFEIRDYLERPLELKELEGLRLRLGLPVREWTRSGEEAFATEGLDDETSDAELMAAIVRHPILLQRPILVRGDRAKIGRPPEQVLELL